MPVNIDDPNKILPDHVTWIDTPSELDRLLDILHNEPVIAVDTEGDSLYSYFEKVCLIQFSTPREDFLVDPLRVNICSLQPVFADQSIQKVFHAVEYDILSLKRDYDFTFANLFDTMLAARILGWPRFGLGHLLAEHFDVKLNKQFQRYNWGKRPLSRRSLIYAHLDTHYLLPLRKLQIEALQAQNRLREAYEAFERKTSMEPTIKAFDPDDFWRIKGARELTPSQQAILRQLYIFRDKLARRLDRPPFKVLNDATLVRLTKIAPHTTADLKSIKGVGKKLVRYNGAEILKVIRNGADMPPPDYSPPNNHHPPDDHTLARYESLRHWRNELAAIRGVEPDVIISNNNLMNIARHNPRSLSALTRLEVLGSWQFETYGKTLLQVLRHA